MRVILEENRCSLPCGSLIDHILGISQSTVPMPAKERVVVSTGRRMRPALEKKNGHFEPVWKKYNWKVRLSFLHCMTQWDKGGLPLLYQL